MLRDKLSCKQQSTLEKKLYSLKDHPNLHLKFLINMIIKHLLEFLTPQSIFKYPGLLHNYRTTLGQDLHRARAFLGNPHPASFNPHGLVPPKQEILYGKKRSFGNVERRICQAISTSTGISEPKDQESERKSTKQTSNT